MRRRRHFSSRWTLLLEIALRVDAGTVVRCAATGKNFRAPSSSRASAAAAAPRQDSTPAPSAASRTGSWTGTKTSAGPASCACSRVPHHRRHNPGPKSGVPEATSLCLEPVAWRDGLAILRHSRCAQRGALTACNRITGHEAPLQDPAALAVRDYYSHALLTVDALGGNFQLLVADKELRFQIYSSRHGKWSAVVRAQRQPPTPSSTICTTRRPTSVVTTSPNSPWSSPTDHAETPPASTGCAIAVARTTPSGCTSWPR